MIRYLLSIGGLLNLLLAVFKIAMPYLFRWEESMRLSPPGMWAILYGENLGISILLLFFTFISLISWHQLLNTGLGKMVMLTIGTLWLYRSVAEILLFKIGVDGAWWRVCLFLGLAGIYFVPFISNRTKHLQDRLVSVK